MTESGPTGMFIQEEKPRRLSAAPKYYGIDDLKHKEVPVSKEDTDKPDCFSRLKRKLLRKHSPLKQ